MKRTNLLTCLLLCTLLTGCVSSTAAEEISITPMQESDLFSNRDTDFSWQDRDVTEIQLQNETLTISEKGVYLLSGSIENGQIVVDAPKDEKVQLVLSGASVHCDTHAALYVKQADKVFVTLAPGTENSLSSGASFIQYDDNNVDAALFSKEDLTLNGEGHLTLSSPAGHGVVSKDELTVTGGTYTVDAASQGFSGQDNLCISGGTFHITAGKDGLHAEHDEDTALGFVFISGGTFQITAAQDGVSASGPMEIKNGTFTLLCGGGSENGEAHTDNMFGGMGGFGGKPGGMGGGRGGNRGGFGGFGDFGGNETENTASAAETAKGLKAGGNLLLTGGTFTLNTADDALHTNASMQVDGGAFTIRTGDDGFHADDTLTINGGDILITESYEGLEGLHIRVNGGSITLTADDDGLNAAGGTDESGYGGRDAFGGGRGGWGGGMPGMSVGNGSIVLSGGMLSVTAYGDGIDANGYLEMTGGQVTVCGPTQGDTATLDYDTTAEISGGTFIGTGAMGMAQTFSGGSQGKIALQVGSAPAGTAFTLQNAAGETLLTHTPALDYSVIILSSPELLIGQSYTLHIGDASGTFVAN